MAVQFLLEEIPSELVRFILKKVEIKDFSKFLQTCHLIFKIGESVRLTIDVKDFVVAPNGKMFMQKVQFTKAIDCQMERSVLNFFKFRAESLVIKPNFCSNSFEHLMDLWKSVQFTCKSLQIQKNVLCESKEFGEYLKKIKPKEIHIYGYVNKNCCIQDQMKMIEEIDLDDCDCGDTEILALSGAKKISTPAPSITEAGVIKFIHEWLENKRNIEHVTFIRPSLSISEIIKNVKGQLTQFQLVVKNGTFILNHSNLFEIEALCYLKRFVNDNEETLLFIFRANSLSIVRENLVLMNAAVC